jgi:hypothetical protein
MRGRLFRRRAQVAAPLAAAAVAVVAGALAAASTWPGDGPVLLGGVAPAALVLAAVAGAFGVWGGRRQLNPRGVRALDVLETTTLVAAVPVVLAVWDVCTTLLGLRA